MTKKLIFAFTILLAVAFVAAAADVSGKWTYEQQMMGRGGDNAPSTVTITLTLKADGSKLTGSILGGFGRGGDQAPQPQEISDGKVDGNKISFSVSRPGRDGGNPMVTTYKGTLDGDTLNLEVTRPGRNGGDPQTTKVAAKRASN